MLVTSLFLTLFLSSFNCTAAAVPRLLTVGGSLSNAAAHFAQLDLRPARYTCDGMWVPKEFVLGGSETQQNDWNIVVISGRDNIDALPDATKIASAAVEVVLCSIGDDSKAWLDLARSVRIGLLVVSEAELAVVESWLLNEPSFFSTPAVAVMRSVRDRAASVGESLSAERICVMQGPPCGAALWCQGGLRANGMRKMDQFFEHPGFGEAGCEARNATGGDSGASAVSSLDKEADAAVAGEAASERADGAEEAFVAALVAALHVDLIAPPKALERACALRAYVASCSGAEPVHTAAPARLRDVFSRSVPAQEEAHEESVWTPYGEQSESERRASWMQAMGLEASDVGE